MVKPILIILIALIALIVVGQLALHQVSQKIANYIKNSISDPKTKKKYSKHRDFAFRTRHLTRIIGVLEALSFYIVTIYLVHIKTVHPMRSILAALLAWIALKGIGNFGDWSHETYGRAVFYKFLIGTLLNIALAVSLAYWTLLCLGQNFTF
jgi:hypothetical protein